MAKTSTIISSTIDETFPVAGQDNDSQGFRDNFNIIKDNFTTTKTDFDDLFNKVLLKAPLNGDTSSLSNALDNETISVVNLLQHTETAYDATGGIGADTNVSFTSGHHYKIQAQDNITLTIVDFPDTDQYAEMRFEITGDGIANRTITFAGEYASAAPSTMLVDGSAELGGTTAITTSTVTSRRHLVKAFTTDGGVNVFLQYLGTFNEA